MPVDEARSLGIKDKDTVMVKVQTKERALIFDDVLVRVGYNYVLSMPMKPTQQVARAMFTAK